MRPCSTYTNKGITNGIKSLLPTSAGVEHLSYRFVLLLFKYGVMNTLLVAMDNEN